MLLDEPLTGRLGLPLKLSFGGMGLRRPEAGVSEAPFSLAPFAGFTFRLVTGVGVDGTDGGASCTVPLVIEA